MVNMPYVVGDKVNIPAEVIAIGKVKGKGGEILEVNYVLKPLKMDIDYIIEITKRSINELQESE